jgi:NAD(P)-dependent dehydrogenase (short-subunit alcohol dehydrogenase family)
VTPERIALITGAASGIGRSFAGSLSAAGWDLILLDVDEVGLTATAGALTKEAVAARIDIGDRPAVEAMAAELIAPRGRLDLLINCAAILGPGTWATQPPEDFERVVRIDLLGTVNIVRAVLPWLRAARGQVVNLASTAAVHGWPGLAAYSAAKFAVAGWSDAIRRELARDGVGVTVVFPLLIDTPLLDRPGTPLILQRRRRIPPDVLVQKTLRAAARRKARVYVPATVRLIAAMHGLAPSLLDWYGERFGIARE